MRFYKPVLVAIALASIALGVQAQEPSFVKPLFGLSYTLMPAGGHRFAARVPVAYDKDAKGVPQIAIATVHVSSPKGSDPSWATCIKSGFHRPEGTTLALLITSTCEALPPATYEVTSAITAADKQQLLVLQVTRPAGELRPLATQTVLRVDSLRAVTTEPAALMLTETSRRTPLTNISAIRVDDVKVGDWPVGGDIKFDHGETDKDGNATLGLHLVGHFPYGKAKTTVAIRANELPTTVYVAYEIHNLLHWWLLFPAIFVGLILGYLTRTVLKRFLDGRSARIAALDLLEKMKRERGRSHDPAFVSAVDPLIAQIETALGGPAAQLTAAVVTATDTSFNKAFADLQQRIVETNRAIDTASASLPASLDFPAAIVAAIKTAELAFAAAHVLANGGDPTAASGALVTATNALNTDVDNAAATWRVDVQGAVATPIQNPLPGNLSAAFAAAIATINTQLAGLLAVLGKDAATILNAVRPVRSAIRHDLMEGVVDRLITYAVATINTLKQKGASTQKSEAALKAFQSAIQSDVDTTLQPFVDALDPLLAALAADKAAAAAIAPVSFAAMAGVAGADFGAATIAALLPTGLMRAATPVFASAVAVQYDPISVARKRTFREIAVAQLASFVMASIGITIAGMLFLLATFDGTWRGLLAAVFWGYAGDISVDALTDAAKKVK
jgi:hypothetical protein